MILDRKETYDNYLLYYHINERRMTKSEEMNIRVSEYIPNGTHYNFNVIGREDKIHFCDGRKSRIWDIDGNEYLDFFCKFGANILGHKNKEYIEALTDALHRITATNLSIYEEDVCKFIVENIPSAQMVRFCLSGTEAVQNAIRLSRAYTGRKKILRFEEHYHGSADNSMGGKMKSIKSPFPVEYKSDTKFTLGRFETTFYEQNFIIPWNNIEFFGYVCEKYKEEIAAVIMEPIAVNAGGIIPDLNYIKYVRKKCNDLGIILIFDEVITGFRVSEGGAQKQFGVTPDLTILGKALSGGSVPLSAVVGKKEIMEYYKPGKVTFGGTYNGYPLGLAAARATLSILCNHEVNYYKKMREMFKKIQCCFVDTAMKYDMDIRFYGDLTCSCFAFDSGGNVNENLLLLGIFREELKNSGVLVSNISTIYSNISITDDDIYFLQNRLDKACKKTRQKLEEINFF